MVGERKIKWHPKINSLTQIPKQGLEYAWVSGDYQQVHQLVWCKDFLHDIVYSCMNMKAINIFKLRYDPLLNPPIYKNKTRLIIANWRDKDFGQKVLENLATFLHAIEKKLDMKPTIFEKCTNIPSIYKRSGVYLLEGDQRWMSAPPMVSLYALLLRLGMVHELGTTFGTTLRGVRDSKIAPYYSADSFQSDKDVLNKSYKTIQRIIKEGDREIFGSNFKLNYPKKNRSGNPLSMWSFHNDFGLSGFSIGLTKTQFPNWHKEKVS